MMNLNEVIEIYINDDNKSIFLGVVTDIGTSIYNDYNNSTNTGARQVCVVKVSYIQPYTNIEGKITAPASSFKNVFILKKENGEEYGIFN